MLKWFRKKKEELAPVEQTPAQPSTQPEDVSPELRHGAEALVLTSSEPITLPEPALQPESQAQATQATRASEELFVPPAHPGLSPQFDQPDEAQEPAIEGDGSNVPFDTLRTAMQSGELPDEAEDIPAVKKGFFTRLRERLTKTKDGLVGKVRAAIRLHGKVDEELLEEIEMILIQSDVGVTTTQKIVEKMRVEGRKQGALTPDALLALFKKSIEEILQSNARRINTALARPTIILMIGVNGTGKTTTIGKIAKQLTDQGKTVMMVAADTFRAAAVEQFARSGASATARSSVIAQQAPAPIPLRRRSSMRVAGSQTDQGPQH